MKLLTNEVEREEHLTEDKGGPLSISFAVGGRPSPILGVPKKTARDCSD